MKKLIVGNWKMNPQTVEEARKLVASFEHRARAVSAHAEIAICTPYVFLPALTHYTNEVKIGAQNVSWQDQGALTGEISAQQLKNFNAAYVILGHSERRLYLGETDSVVNAKILAALRHKITPIVCLGGEEGAKKDDMKSLVTRQFTKVTNDLDMRQLAKIVYVYEPVWAISTVEKSQPATGEHALELVKHIYDLLENRIGHAAQNVRILYGGTVNKNNVHQYARHPEIGGALVGAASLDWENFWHIVQEFNRESIHHI